METLEIRDDNESTEVTPLVGVDRIEGVGSPLQPTDDQRAMPKKTMPDCDSRF